MMKKLLGKWRPLIVGAVWGILLSVSVLVQPIEPNAKAPLVGAIFLSNASIGALVMLLPLVGPRWLFGLLVGVVYTVPMAMLRLVSFPISADAPAFWHQYAGGGPLWFFLALLGGGVVGVLCALPKQVPAEQRDAQSDKLARKIMPEPPRKIDEAESLLEAEDAPAPDSPSEEKKSSSRIFKENKKPDEQG